MNAPKLLEALNRKMNKAKNCFFFHSWSKWERYSNMVDVLGKKPPSGMTFYTTRQKRFCVDCGFSQDEEIF